MRYNSTSRGVLESRQFYVYKFKSCLVQKNLLMIPHQNCTQLPDFHCVLNSEEKD
jgi:hypothetical protein